jgi:hypothetical protein
MGDATERGVASLGFCIIVELISLNPQELQPCLQRRGYHEV